MAATCLRDAADFTVKEGAVLLARVNHAQDEHGDGVGDGWVFWPELRRPLRH